MLALYSAIPILLLFILMLGIKMPSHRSASLVLIITALLTIFVSPEIGLKPSPVDGSPGSIVLWSVVSGILKAIFPILLIILMAIFSYNVLVESGQIEVIKQQFTSFTEDKGIMVLMMVWGFGGLLEGLAGFGTSVAIPAAILIRLGFKPVFSAIVALLGNSVTSAFGAVGVPVSTLCNEVTSDISADSLIYNISVDTVIQLSPLYILVPFAILMLTDHRQWVKNLALAIWTGGITLSVQYVCARWIGVETPTILGSLAAMLALYIFTVLFSRTHDKTRAKRTRGDLSIIGSLKAWSVYIIILALILITGPLCPAIEQFCKEHLISQFYLPVIGEKFTFRWISNAALWLFVGSLAGGMIQGLRPTQLMRVLAKTILNLRTTTITICSLIAIAAVMNYGGMITTLASGLVDLSGSYYPMFAPLIGAIGTFVTGSVTASNILFGKLQAQAAFHLGMNPINTEWLVASNTVGCTGGKIISPQSIAIATAACNMKGKDDSILRKALPYAIAYILISGLIVYLGCR